DVQGRSRVAPESGHPPSRTDLAEAATMTPRAPRAGRRLVTLSASLALHGGLLLAVLLAVSGETEPDALFIDLTEAVRPEADAAGHRCHRRERSRGLGRGVAARVSRRCGRIGDREGCASSSRRAGRRSRRRARRESRLRSRGAGWWRGRRGWPRSRVRRLSRK